MKVETINPNFQEKANAAVLAPTQAKLKEVQRISSSSNFVAGYRLQVVSKCNLVPKSPLSPTQFDFCYRAPMASLQQWQCSACTFRNSGARTMCEICQTPRPTRPVAPAPAPSKSAAPWNCAKYVDWPFLSSTRRSHPLMCRCTFLNPASATACQACNSVKSKRSFPFFWSLESFVVPVALVLLVPLDSFAFTFLLSTLPPLFHHGLVCAAVAPASVPAPAPAPSTRPPATAVPNERDISDLMKMGFSRDDAVTALKMTVRAGRQPARPW